ncbi:MAG: hypothetical protein OXE50_08515 [Chloroflexi bacterium]|nr:hypothetical protein [Chloroflexota bacterium]
MTITFGPNNLTPSDPDDQVRGEWWFKLDSLAQDSVHYFNHINRHVGVVTLEICDSNGDPVMLNGSAVRQQ